MTHIWYNKIYSPYLNLMYIRVLKEYFNIPTSNNILTPQKSTASLYERLAWTCCKYSANPKISIHKQPQFCFAKIQNFIGISPSPIYGRYCSMNRSWFWLWMGNLFFGVQPVEETSLYWLDISINIYDILTLVNNTINCLEQCIQVVLATLHIDLKIFYNRHINIIIQKWSKCLF